jgi:leucyl-tRNA synthetase
VANAAILKLTTELQLIEKLLPEVRPDADLLRGGTQDEELLDRLFSNDMARCIAAARAAHEAHQFRDALIASFDLLQHARDRYRLLIGSRRMHKELVREFVRVSTLLLAPFCPHYAEHVWGLLGNKDSIMHAAWPRGPPGAETEDAVLSRVSSYLDATLTLVRIQHEKSKRGGAKGGGKGGGKDSGKDADKEGEAGPASLIIFVAREYLEWQAETLRVMSAASAAGASLDKDFKKGLLAHAALQPFLDGNPQAKKSLLPFVQFKIDELHARGLEALEQTLPFDEADVLVACKEALTADLALQHLEVAAWPPTPDRVAALPAVGKLAPPTPGNPTCFFY